MADFGLATSCTHYSIQPAELGKWAEAHGFESLWFAEHTHIPVSRKTPFPIGGELPQPYKEFFDPFVGLTAAAAVTTKLKFGTSVCLVPEHNPITLAKTIASLDRVSNGEFLFGVGAGWNAEEMADHGVDIADRWKVTRERILAMKEIWTKDVAEYHGEFVKFDPLWSWPKPIQPAGPPILLGSHVEVGCQARGRILRWLVTHRRELRGRRRQCGPRRRNRGDTSGSGKARTFYEGV
jgi:probable F420-dependent oxidoreductase